MTYAADLEAEQHARESLAEGLRWAVPLCMLELRRFPPGPTRRRRLPHGTVAYLGEGDAVMFHTKNWKTTALAFRSLAFALAYLALETPDGATLFGVHWCVGDHEGCPHADRPGTGPPRDWREPLDELERLARAEGLAA